MPEPDIELLMRAVREAGKIATGFFEGPNKVWDKGSEGPVTEADMAVDAHLREALMTARPDHAWMSEETEDDTVRLGAERVFVVDPIDGTRAFVAGEKTWSHSVAIVDNGRPVAGAVYLPLLDRMYSATRGGGAFLNGTAIRAKRYDGRPRILASKPAFKPEHWSGDIPDIDRHFRPSLAYRISLVAEGRFDGMLTLRDSWEWDIAAGSLIAEEAGASVSDRYGAPLRFNGETRKTPGIVAAEAGVHADLTKRLHERPTNA